MAGSANRGGPPLPRDRAAAATPARWFPRRSHGRHMRRPCPSTWRTPRSKRPFGVDIAGFVTERDHAWRHDLPAPIDGGERVGQGATGESQIDHGAAGDVAVLRVGFHQRGQVEMAQVDGAFDPSLRQGEVGHDVSVYLPRRRARVERELQTAERPFRRHLEGGLQRIPPQRRHEAGNFGKGELVGADLQIQRRRALIRRARSRRSPASSRPCGWPVGRRTPSRSSSKRCPTGRQGGTRDPASRTRRVRS